jgi:hypothetical protein
VGNYKKVGMLITLSDKRTKIITRKAILGDDLRPDVSVVKTTKAPRKTLPPGIARVLKRLHYP